MSVCANLLKGKKGVILGVANKWSIAWGIAQALHDAGAEFALTYPERVQSRVEKLAQELGTDVPILECDVSDDAQIERVFADLSRLYDGKLDFVVHSVAFSKKEELEGRYIDTSRDGFALAMDISVFSLTAVAKHARPLMNANGGGSIVTLTYLGAERVVQNYNVMGAAKAALESSVRYLANDLGPEKIRVNSISAGPIKTLAASAISGINSLIEAIASVSPLRKNIDIDEVGDVALFLVSDLSRAVTAENIHVDSGFHALGAVKAPA